LIFHHIIDLAETIPVNSKRELFWENEGRTIEVHKDFRLIFVIGNESSLCEYLTRDFSSRVMIMNFDIEEEKIWKQVATSIFVNVFNQRHKIDLVAKSIEEDNIEEEDAYWRTLQLSVDSLTPEELSSSSIKDVSLKFENLINYKKEKKSKKGSLLYQPPTTPVSASPTLNKLKNVKAALNTLSTLSVISKKHKTETKEIFEFKYEEITRK
jgi:hypothetical protein